MSFAEWYKEHESLDKESFERELEIYKNDVIANLGMSSDKNAVYIVNAGRMNHGKSSLFNSLLGREEFQAKDVRTTVKNKEVKWKDNIILVDTPGLDAVDEDTSKAYEAYYNADLIFFVHTVRTGELHDSEIEAIKKISKNFTKDYFWKHFCLVLSFKESVDADSLEKITQESVNAINKACNADEFAVFTISNSRYLKGVAENKKGLINHSGILDLLDYIDAQIDAWYRESIDKNEDVLRDNLLKICKEANSVLQAQKNSENINKNMPGGGKSVDELREIVKTFKLEIDDLDKKYLEKQDRWRSVQDKISKLNDRNIEICAWYDKQDEYDRNSRELDRLMAEQEKIDGEQERLENEKNDKEDEAQLTCVKLGILDEELAFSYKLVMDNIDKISSQMKNDGNKLDYVRDFCNEMERISKSDNLLLLVKNGEMSKHLRILGVAAELSGDDDIKKNETIILSKIQQSDGRGSNDNELQSCLNSIYKGLYAITSDIKGTISGEIKRIDDEVNAFIREAEARCKEIIAVIDADAYLARNREIAAEMQKTFDEGNFGKTDELLKLKEYRDTEFRQLIDKRTEMLDKATDYFRKYGVLNDVEKFYTDTIDEYIDKYADNLYENNVNELQEKLRKLTNGLRSVKVIGELVGIKVTE